MACTNFGTANAYNVFLLGDHTQRNSQAGGLVAVGGRRTRLQALG
ncbi:collagen-binding domain-containing protein [Cohnella sp.]